eukprot:1159428-Pelagomonas_calceolata.AAC.4
MHACRQAWGWGALLVSYTCEKQKERCHTPSCKYGRMSLQCRHAVDGEYAIYCQQNGALLKEVPNNLHATCEGSTQSMSNDSERCLWMGLHVLNTVLRAARARRNKPAVKANWELQDPQQQPIERHRISWKGTLRDLQ